MQKPTLELVNFLAHQEIVKVAEKPRFGKPFIRLGPLVSAVGMYIFQAGGSLGYSLRENSTLLGKLLGVDSGREEEFISSLKEPADIRGDFVMSGSSAENKDFHATYVLFEYATMGMVGPRGVDESELKEKCDSNLSQMVTTLAFSSGVGFGYFQPQQFVECWESTYGVGEDSRRTLEMGISQTAIGVHQWTQSDAEGYLAETELDIVKELVEKSGHFLID